MDRARNRQLDRHRIVMMEEAQEAIASFDMAIEVMKLNAKFTDVEKIVHSGIICNECEFEINEY